jgi:predicted N-acyltransferase
MADAAFARAVAQYLAAEARSVDHEIEVLTAYGPFRRTAAVEPE